MSFFWQLFDTSGFTPRWSCGRWSSSHGLLHIASDLLIAFAYFAIPALLIYFMRQRRDVPFRGVFWLFAAFILSCGIGHAVEASLFWTPWYRFSGLIKAVTAVVSWVTVLALIPLLPRVLALPGLELMNQQLRDEIQRREAAEAERRKLEATLVQSQKLESLGVLAGGIAHDFNNLLTSILGYTELAASSLPEKSSERAMLAEAVRGAERAGELASQMLAFAGRGRIARQTVVMSDLVADMLRLVTASIPKRITVRHHPSQETPPLHADATQLRQVVMNLVLNAAEAIGDTDGWIDIRTGGVRTDGSPPSAYSPDDPLPPGEYAYLEVTDTGCGMVPDTIARIFEPFFTTKFTGRGLGLAAVQGVVRGHDGAIQVESRLGNGTTMRVLLPTAAGSAATASPDHSQVADEPLSGVALVVDDEDTVRRTVAEMLRLFGLEVETASNGREALDRFVANPPRYAVVVLDLIMPVMDGLEAFAGLRECRPDVPVILMSGYADRTVPPSGTGPVRKLNKPFRIEELRRQVVSCLRGDPSHPLP